jgi:hypothetical protein
MEIPPAPEQLMAVEGSGGERLVISHIVVENFKSYFGCQTLGPFHKVGLTLHLSYTWLGIEFRYSISELYFCHRTKWKWKEQRHRLASVRLWLSCV